MYNVWSVLHFMYGITMKRSVSLPEFTSKKLYVATGSEIIENADFDSFWFPSVSTMNDDARTKHDTFSASFFNALISFSTFMILLLM